MSRTCRVFIGLASALATLSVTGCVERRYTIRSDPPGALAIVNGEEKGITPVSSSYVYYGKRTIRLVKDGFEPLDIVQDFPAPWYDNYLTEVVTENLVPYTFRDERTLTYKLKPEQTADANKLLSDAEALRADARSLPKPHPGGILGWLGFD
jgi:hypothetical protein